jgi:hypothetical protein
MRRWTAWACLGVCAASCAASSTRDGGTPVDGGFTDAGADAGAPFDAGGSGLLLADACAALGLAECSFLQRCGLIASDPSALQDCQAFLGAAECNATLWPARVTAGTLGYEAVAAQACVAAIASAACSDWPALPDVCADILSPAVPSGGRCFGGPYTECLSGVCRGAACPFQCQAPGLSGDPCERDGDCQSDAGLYCHFNGPASVSQCQLPAGPGASCGATTHCAAGTYCDGRYCQPLRAPGQSCTAQTCQPSAWCQPGVDGGICAERLGAGLPCSYSAECASGMLCLPETHLCTVQGPLAQGAPCYVEQTCALGSTCVGATGISPGFCAAPLGLGVHCLISVECEADLACLHLQDAGACLPRLADGTPCASDADCRLGSGCANGICRRIPRVGDPCPGGMCLIGECTAGPDGGICTGPASVGASCTRDLDCASERCMQTCLPACGP